MSHCEETRISVYWTDDCRWFMGTAGATRGDGATMVTYDPVDDWVQISDLSNLHVLSSETWRVI